MSEPPVLVWLNADGGLTLEQRCEDGSVSAIYVDGDDLGLLIVDLRVRLRRLGRAKEGGWVKAVNPNQGGAST